MRVRSPARARSPWADWTAAANADYLGNLVRLVVLLPLVIPARAGLGKLFRLQWKGALLVAAISPISYVLVLYAMQVAPLSHVAPAREVSMLFAALIVLMNLLVDIAQVALNPRLKYE